MPDQACAGSHCVSVECTPENRSACPESASCTSGECGAPMGCVVPECRAEGFCFSAPDDSLCLQSEYCDALLGCVARGVPVDASMGPPDAGVDAGPPTETGGMAFPWNGAITGVTPTLHWVGVTGATEHQLVIDDSCDPFDFDPCAFPSPELDRRVAATEVLVPPLAVSATPPVGRRYFARVRGCNASGCGPWSPVRYFDAGRVRGDVNGDGFSDAVVGAPGGVGEGAAYVLFGGAGGATALSFPDSLYSSAFSPDTNDLFGSDVAFVGDVDADGCADFAVGAPGGNTPTVADVGMAHLYLGNVAAGPTLAVFTHTQISPGIVGSRFGGTIAGLGDVDRDGRADIGIGAIGETSTGAAYVLFGRDLSTGTMTRIPPPSATDFAFGTTIAGIGLREPWEFGSFLVATNSSAGLAYHFGVLDGVFSTTSTGFPASPRSEPMDGFGGSIAATCDLDGDDLTDPVISSSAYRGTGAVVIFYAHGTVTWIDPPSPVINFGSTVACADLTSDGIDDLVITSDSEEAVYLYEGGSRSPMLNTIGTIAPASRVGYSAATGFDFDGDGHLDSLFGAPGMLGQVVVALGPWHAGTNGTAIDSGSGASDQFGWAVAIAPP